MKKTALIASLFFALPFIASAQTVGNVQNLIFLAGRILNALIPILIALAVIIFFWGLIKYIMGSAKSAAAGKSIMIAGIVALFIMVSIWGIINFIQNSLGVNNNAPVTVPQVPQATSI